MTTSTLAAILVMTAAEAALLVWAALTPGPYALRGRVISVNMIAIALFGPMLVDLGGVVTNVPNICYATVIAAQCVVLERHGIAAARHTVRMVNATLMAVFTLTLCLHLFPAVPGNESMAGAVRQLTHHTPSVMIASFAAFFLSQEALWRVWRRLRTAHSRPVTLLVAAIAAQAVDSPVFFLVAFYAQVPSGQLTEMMAAGFLFKSVLAVALLPAVLLALHVEDVRHWLRGTQSPPVSGC